MTLATVKPSVAPTHSINDRWQAIVFDFDGTLVDTMPLHYEAYRSVFADLGIELSPDDFYGNVGGNAKETIPKFLRGRLAAISHEEIHDRKKRRFLEIIDVCEVPVLPLGKLLPLFAKLLPLAIASSGSRIGIEQILKNLEWKQFFRVVVTAEDASHGKPHPDLYLCAAQRLQVAPEACLAFDDTDDGVAAAATAGMNIFDVRKMSSVLRASSS